MLLRGLHANSIERVRDALDRDPGAVHEPLFDSGMEPPLCAAVRLGCSERILSLLLDRGADVHWADVWGREPLHILSMSQQSWMWPSRAGVQAPSLPAPDEDGGLAAWVRLYETGVANVLLQAGASPTSPQVRGGAASSSLGIAESTGKSHLVDVFRDRVAHAADAP